MSGEVILSVDAGGQSFKFSLLEYRTLQPLFLPVYLKIDANGTKEAILGVWHEIISRGMKETVQRGKTLCAMACSCPGPFDYYQGISLMDHKWAAIKGVQLVEDFHTHGLSPEVPVFFCHDAHSLILGEMAAGVAKGYRRVGGYIIGTGIGFGAVCDGELQADAKGCPVFGMYRKPYRGETIEDFASSRGVPRLYGEIIGVPTTMTAKDIGDLAEKGDEAAIRAYQAMGRAVATVSADMIREYLFDCLVFGGRISQSFPIFIPAFQDELLQKGVNAPHLVQSVGGELLAMTGAASYGKRKLEGKR